MAPWQHDIPTAVIGAGLVIGVLLSWVARSVPFAVLIGRALSFRDFDDHCATTPGLDDLRTLPVEEAAFEVLRPRVLAAAEAITKEAAS